MLHSLRGVASVIAECLGTFWCTCRAVGAEPLVGDVEHGVAVVRLDHTRAQVWVAPTGLIAEYGGPARVDAAIGSLGVVVGPAGQPQPRQYR